MEIYEDIFTNLCHKPIIDDKMNVDKNMIRRTLTRSILKKAYMMLRYENLPEGIPQRMIRTYLQTCGHFAGFRIGEEKVISWGTFSGTFDKYYFPKQYIVTNPYMVPESRTMEIGKDCIIVKNDSLAEGLVDHINKYVQMLVENETSMVICDILARAQGLLIGKDDAQVESARQYLNRLFAGTVVPVKSDSFQQDNMETVPFGTAHYILTDLIEYEQYIRSALYTELGIKLNYNMKREALNSNETDLDEEILKPYIDNMIETQQEDFDMLSDFWKLDVPIKVMKNSVWEDMDLQDQVQEATAEAAIKAAEEGKDPESTGTEEPEEPETGKEEKNDVS